jgi:short-subunit dehydrogenase
VIHGIRVFTPIMLKQNEPCHIVNTASLAGLLSGPGLTIYSVTKHAVVTLSEGMFHELKMKGAKIGISVLCPAWVKTGIMESDRNRPGELKNEAGGAMKPEDQMLEKMVKQLVTQGQAPEKIAGDVFNAIVNERFYILTHPEFKELIRIRMEDILEERQPTYRPMA